MLRIEIKFAKFASLISMLFMTLIIVNKAFARTGTKDGKNLKCDLSGGESLAMMTSGRFKVMNVEHFSISCAEGSIVGKMKYVVSPFCFLNVKRLSNADPLFDKSDSYLVSGVTSSCNRKVGDKIELNLTGWQNGDPAAYCEIMSESDFFFQADRQAWSSMADADFACILNKLRSKGKSPKCRLKVDKAAGGVTPLCN